MSPLRSQGQVKRVPYPSRKDWVARGRGGRGVGEARKGAEKSLLHDEGVVREGKRACFRRSAAIKSRAVPAKGRPLKGKREAALELPAGSVKRKETPITFFDVKGGRMPTKRTKKRFTIEKQICPRERGERDGMGCKGGSRS